MFEPDAPTVPVRVDHYPIGSLSITALMPELLATINQSSTLKHKLFQLEFLSTTGGEVLISLIYHRQLDEQWEVEARLLEQQFNILITYLCKTIKIKTNEVILPRTWMRRCHRCCRYLAMQS
jgi:tRNA (uracil-5-)-methyltransferase